MTERPEGAPAQPQPQDQPSATPPGPPGQPGPAHPAQPQPAVQPQTPPQAQLPASPSAYPYPNPQSPAGFGPPAASLPTQHNPYGQPQPGGYPPAGYPTAPAAPGSGGAGRAVLWAVLGAVLASAAWAGGVFLLGRDDEADLRGYEAKSELCREVEHSSFDDEYPEEDSSPVNQSLEHEALDQSYCSLSLKKSSTSTLSDAYFSVELELHKKTDPGPEFTARWAEYDQRYDDYEVERISGFGDEAYLVTEDTTSGSDSSGSRSATLAVRDGWVTYEMSWSAYASSYDDDAASLPEVAEVTDWLKTDTTATLENLKEIDGV
ncbi:hypothetical protein P9869_42795 [Streptomyces ossamyceticus]|nr:hypothetical protein [Streptomyces ossamyceticus]